MQTKYVSFVAIVIAVVCWWAGSCFYNPDANASSLLPDNLSGDALRTHAAYINAVNLGKEQQGTIIPRIYWADRIKALNPIKVYIHRVNIVIVREITDEIEKGIYVFITISSYFPQSGDDGFEFTPDPATGSTYSLGDGVFEYTRTNAGSTEYEANRMQ